MQIITNIFFFWHSNFIFMLYLLSLLTLTDKFFRRVTSLILQQKPFDRSRWCNALHMYKHIFCTNIIIV